MASDHTIRATWLIDDDNGVELDIDIAFSFTPGAPDTYDAARGGPGGWDPGYAAEVELVSATAVPSAGGPAVPSQACLDRWAREWLQGDGYAEAVAHADRHSGLDPDDARDAAIEDARMERGR